MAITATGLHGAEPEDDTNIMASLTALLAPVALVLPLGLFGLSGDAESQQHEVRASQVQQQARTDDRRLSGIPLSAEAPGWSPLIDGIQPPSANQVRIERRIILRVSPARAPIMQQLTAETRSQQRATRLVERKFGDCVTASAIAGVADRGDRLLMYLRDRRLLSARLEKGCSPRDFYQGFYMEPAEDGKLCVDRDRLMSRTGAKCQVAMLRQLVVEQAD